MTEYQIDAYVWDKKKEEYIPETLTTTDDLEEAQKIYDSITVNADMVQIELWIETTFDCERLRAKDEFGEIEQ